MEQKSFVELPLFRKMNNLSQDDMARILNVSRAYVSLVESGRSKLSREKIKIIVESDYLDIGFIPAFDRIRKVEDYLQISFKEKNPYVSPQEYELIKWGDLPINENIANAISSKYPINYGWLISGEGEMIRYDDATTITPAEQKSLDVRLAKLEEKIDKILSLLGKNCN